MKFNKTKKTFIKVFWTKTGVFRAEICEPNQPSFEVTIGGTSWKAGKGQKYKDKIFDRMWQLSLKMFLELQKQTGKLFFSTENFFPSSTPDEKPDQPVGFLKRC